MKVHEIRELDPKELAQRIAEREEELANLKFQLALHQLDNTAKVRMLRREYARMVTVMREHELGIRKLVERKLGLE